MKNAIFLSIAFIASCGDLKEETKSIAPKLIPSRVQTIFTNSCSCHTSAFPPQGMSLVTDQAYDNTVNRASSEVPSLKRIEPGNAGLSYLVRKIEGSQSVGSRMPADGPPYLSAANIDSIKGWINAGALPE